MRGLLGTLASSGVGAIIGAGMGLVIWYLSYLPMRLDIKFCVMTGAVIGLFRGFNEYGKRD
jgi:hypothetical protein